MTEDTEVAIEEGRPGPAPPSRWRRAGPHVGRMVVVFAFAMALLARSYGVYFMADDFDFFIEFNRRVRDFADVLDFQFWGLYEPVFTVSFFLDYKLAGYEPALFHVSSNLAYATTAVFVYLLVLVLSSGRKNLALFAGLLFAADPLHDEAVLYLAARAHVLALMFSVLTFYLFARRRAGGERWFYPASYVTFILAFLSKESALLVPPIVFLLDVLFFAERSFSWRTLWRASVRSLAYVAIVVVYLVLRASLLDIRGDKLSKFPELESIWERVALYFSMQFMPLPFSIMELEKIDRLRLPGYAAIALLVVLLAWAWRRTGGRPRWLRFAVFGVVVFFMAIVPVLSPSLTVHRRYLYYASFGSVMAITGFAMACLDRRYAVERRRTYVSAALAAIIAILGTMFILRVEMYRNASALLRRTIAAVDELAGPRRIVAIPIFPYWYGGDSLNGAYLVHPDDLKSAARLFIPRTVQVRSLFRTYFAEDIESRIEKAGSSQFDLVMRCPEAWTFDHFVARTTRYARQRTFIKVHGLTTNAAQREMTVTLEMPKGYRHRIVVLQLDRGDYHVLAPTGEPRS